jgi:uncharacterized protein (DUF697 family)
MMLMHAGSAARLRTGSAGGRRDRFMAEFKPRGSAKDFWDTIKGVSVNDIARDAARPVSVAIVGRKGARSAAREGLFASAAGTETANSALPEPSFLQEFDSTSADAGFPQDATVFDVIIDVGSGRKEAPEGAHIYSIDELGGWEAALDRIIDDRPRIALALARNFPAFRRRVANDIIVLTATANAQFALVTGITSAFPLLSLILPVNGLSDMLMLTKNQAMMTLRLAAAYGLDVSVKSRMKDLAPVLMNAFGWRAIARELVGAVPVVGFVARAGIAYAGTVTVGKSAMVFYETGEKISKEQLKRWYKDALETSRGRIKSLADAVKRRRKPQRALPPEADQADIVDTEIRDLSSAGVEPA